MIQFTVPGPPVPKKRARVLRNGHSYTDKRTVDYETSVAEAAMVAKVKVEPGHVGYTLGFEFYLSARYWNTDLGNLLKAGEDGLQRYLKAAYGWDDGQVVKYRNIYKTLCAKGEERTVVTLWETL